MIRPLMIIGAVWLLLAPPAHAQNPWEHAASVEQALARAIADAMPDTRYPHQLGWSHFGVRGGRDIYWHMAPFDEAPDRRLPEGVHRRTGWLWVNGASGDVAVCGDRERIGGMTIRVSSIWLGGDDRAVIAALAARDVRATLLETREHPDGDADGPFPSYYREMLLERHSFTKWRLEQDGHEPVTLSASHACSPPGMRSAVQCRITWRIAFTPDAPDTPGADCPIPGREWE